MIFGSVPFGSQAFMGQSQAVDVSTPARFDALIQDQEAERSYLILLRAYRKFDGAEVTLYYSSGVPVSILLVNGVPYQFQARLMTAVNYQTDIFSSGILVAQASSQSYGVISLHLDSGDLDLLATQFAYDGRSFSILMGEPDYTFDEYRVVLTGACKDVSWTEDLLTISAEDPGGSLSQQPLSDRYTGNGYDAVAAKFTGDAALSDVNKPLCLGDVRNIDPVLVDSTLFVYQYHASRAGDTTAVTGTLSFVYDMGVPLTIVNVADQQAVYAWTPVPGSVAVSPDGFLRLGAQPAGLITCDASVTVYYSFAGTWVNTVPSIIAYLVQNRMAAPLTIDTSSFASVAASSTGPVGFWAPDASQITVGDMVSRLLESIGGYYSFNTDGTFRIGIFGFSAPVLTLMQPKITSIQREVTSVPSHSRFVDFAPTWRVQSESELASGVDSYHRQVVSRPHTTIGATANSAAILARRKLAVTTSFNSLHLDARYPGAELTRQAALLEPDRDLYTVVAGRVQFRLAVGNTVHVTYPRFSLDRDFIVVGVVEDTNAQSTTLKLWG